MTFVSKSDHKLPKITWLFYQKLFFQCSKSMQRALLPVFNAITFPPGLPPGSLAALTSLGGGLKSHFTCKTY